MTAKRVGGHALVVLGVVTCAGALVFLLAQGVAHGTDETWGGGTDAALPLPSENWLDHLPGLPTPHGPPSDEVGSHTYDTPYKLKCGWEYQLGVGPTVIAGTTYAEVEADWERHAFADAWYDTPGNECGYGHDLGDNAWSWFDVKLMPGFALGRGTITPSFRSKHQLSVHEYTSTNCTTGYVRSFNDTSGYCLWQAPYPGSVTSEDPARDCHTPRVHITGRPSGTTLSYKTEISTRICDFDGTNCNTVSSDTGCFRMDRP